MAVEDLDQLDMEVAYRDGSLRLVILDGLPWGDDDAISYHLTMVHRKINAYLDYADSDDVRQKHPGFTLDKLTIEIVIRYQPAPDIEEYLDTLSDKLADDGVTLVRTIRP